MARGKFGKKLRNSHRKLARGGGHGVTNTDQTKGKRVTKKRNAARRKRGVTHEEHLDFIKMKMRCGAEVSPVAYAEVLSLTGRYDPKTACRTNWNMSQTPLEKLVKEQTGKNLTVLDYAEALLEECNPDK